MSPLYLSGTMEGPLCADCGHLLPRDGVCLLHQACPHGYVGEKVWLCRDAFGNVRYLDEPCGGADSAEGCGWRLLIPIPDLAKE